MSCLGVTCRIPGVIWGLTSAVLTQKMNEKNARGWGGTGAFQKTRETVFSAAAYVGTGTKKGRKSNPNRRN